MTPVPLLARLHCLLYGHLWSDWKAGVHIRYRWCNRCGREEAEEAIQGVHGRVA